MLAQPVLAQVQSPTPGPGDDVVRVNADLVQTDVMVFDKQGNFVDGLKPDQFVLKIDGKQREISFFDRIMAGSRNEEAQLAAARGNARVPTRPGSRAVPLDRGRTVFFFIDDLHLSLSSINSTRKLLLRYIDREMRQNDDAAIVSASGQIGFLQQLTDDKAVLRAAVQRLTSRPYDVRDMDYPRMSESQALAIERNDDDVLTYFVDALVKEDPQLPRGTAADQTRARAQQILQQAASITTNTLASIKTVVDTSRTLPGRKILFMISDGFFLDSRNSDSYDRLRRITSAAAASGTVIYSIDARGLTTGAPDAKDDAAVDLSGRLARAGGGELSASRDGLNALASDTGGRAFFNSNFLPAAVTAALKDSSVYYLLAWRPANEEQRNPKYRRIEVGVVGHADLLIRFRHGFGETGSSDAAKRSKNNSAPPARKTPDEELTAALRAPYPLGNLPICVSLNFINDPRLGPTLTSSLKISTNSLALEAVAGTLTAVLDVAGLVLNDQGKSVSTFNKRLTIKTTNGTTAVPESVFYNHFSLIKPGLYQVRVAAVDVKQGRSGSASQWIEIPDLQSNALTLSSLIVGEKRASQSKPGELDSKAPEEPGSLGLVILNVDHHFARTSHLRFLTFIYNAATDSSAQTAVDPTSINTVPASTKAGSPDLAVQVQVFRDNEPVVTMPLHKIQTDGVADLRRLPYAAEVSLDDLLPGRYVLLVTVIDRLAKSSASQKFIFQID